jgi:hypothetical protein
MRTQVCGQAIRPGTGTWARCAVRQAGIPVRLRTRRFVSDAAPARAHGTMDCSLSPPVEHRMVNISRSTDAGRFSSPPPVAPSSSVSGSASAQRAAAPSAEIQGLALRGAPGNASSAMMAPRAGVPSALPSPASQEVSLQAAKSRVGRLMSELCVVVLPMSSSTEALEDHIEAGRAVLDYYATLPRNVQVRVLTDSDVRKIRNAMLAESHLINLRNESEGDRREAQWTKTRDQVARLAQLNRSREPGDRLDLTKMYSSLEEQSDQIVRFWDRLALRAASLLSTMERVAPVFAASPAERVSEVGRLIRKTGEVMMARFCSLHAQVDFALARWGTYFQGLPDDAPARKRAMEAVQPMLAFQADIYLAYRSAVPAVLERNHLDEPTRAVLEDVIGRLQEFTSGLETATAAQRAHPADEAAPPDLVHMLDCVIERVWITADDTRRTLDVHVATPANDPSAVLLEPARAAGAQAAAGPSSAAEPKDKAKGKGKVKAKPKGGASVPPGAAGRAGREAAPAAVADDSGQVLGRSKMGTRILVDRPSAANAEAQATLPERLQDRLTRVLAFDVSEEQRAVSSARAQLSPEAAGHIVAETVRRLEAQAVDMRACLSALAKPGLRQSLGPVQMRETHDQVEQLQRLLPQVEGIAHSLKDGLAGATLAHMKTYRFPTQPHIEALLRAGEIAAAEAPRALKGEPGTLFEVRLQPEALRNGELPPPIWLHIHTRRDVPAQQLGELADADFAACHVKSDAERGRNRVWQDARAREGHTNVTIHRGRIAPKLAKSFMAV